MSANVSTQRFTTGDARLRIGRGHVDEGGWHRAVVIANMMVAAGMIMEDLEYLTIHDPYQLHGDLSLEKMPIRDLKLGQDYETVYRTPTGAHTNRGLLAQRFAQISADVEAEGEAHAEPDGAQLQAIQTLASDDDAGVKVLVPCVCQYCQCQYVDTVTYHGPGDQIDDLWREVAYFLPCCTFCFRTRAAATLPPSITINGTVDLLEQLTRYRAAEAIYEHGTVALGEYANQDIVFIPSALDAVFVLRDMAREALGVSQQFDPAPESPSLYEVPYE